MKRTRIARGAMIWVFMLLPAAAWAQSATTGSIAGLVKDTTGAVLPGVTVEAASPALIEKARTVVTDNQGQYKIVELRPGTYTVTFTLAGFSTVKREALELTTGFTATANAEMKVGALEETITVSGASPVVDTQNVRSENVLSRDVLDAVPTSKMPTAYAALTLGVITGGSSSVGTDVGGSKGEGTLGLGIHGGRMTDLEVYVDGMSILNMLGGGNSKWLAYDQAAVQEVTLETSGSVASGVGGIQMNAVPKDGGNTFRGAFNADYSDKNLQTTNLSDALNARGVVAPPYVSKIYDIGGGLGGPIRQDKLWFYTALRKWYASEDIATNFYNKIPDTLFYEPDVSRPGARTRLNEDLSLRLTWQAAKKHKINLNGMFQHNCSCSYGVDLIQRPEATTDNWYGPAYQVQANWSAPVTEHLLYEAAVSRVRNSQDRLRAPGVSATARAVTDLADGYQYGSNASGLTLVDYGSAVANTFSTRFSTAYITGSHAFKVGGTTQSGDFESLPQPNYNVSYTFRNRVPASLTEAAAPLYYQSRLKLSLGIYAQDQWTLKNLTLNLGVRFDSFNGYNPAQTRPAGEFSPQINSAPVYNVPNWKDLGPRLGAAYNLFGNGKTAVKVFLGRYLELQTANIAQATNPGNAVVKTVTRTWNDANKNYVPDCDLHNPFANSECGPISNLNFGTIAPNTTYDLSLLNGFGHRGYNWQGSALVQQELRPGTALTVGYFRTSFGNFTVTQNTAVTSADFNPYCIAEPVDPRLPGGGGNQVCGLYDIKPTAFGKVNNLVTFASNFGNQTEVYNGVDVSITSRFGKGGIFSGGVSAGRTVTDFCNIVTNHPDVVATSSVLGASGPSTPTQFCRATLPFAAQTQVKINGSYPLPWNLQASAVFQNLPGIPDLTSYVATNAQVAPSLSRNLGQCGTSATCNGTVLVSNLYTPNAALEDRLSQLDLRLNKIFGIGKKRIQVHFDVYNALNGNAIAAMNTRFGASLLQPTFIQSARLFKFGGQLDF